MHVSGTYVKFTQAGVELFARCSGGADAQRMLDYVRQHLMWGSQKSCCPAARRTSPPDLTDGPKKRPDPKRTANQLGQLRAVPSSDWVKVKEPGAPGEKRGENPRRWS